MTHAALSPISFAAALGVVFGLIVLGRGMAGQRRAARLGDTSSSTISAIAVGEVRVSGLVDPAELSLTSPLQSAACVYYRAKITEERDRSERTILDEERAVGFRVRDASGDIRVFPAGAQWLVPDVYSESSGIMGDEPAGLELRSGSVFRPTDQTREAMVAELLTVHPASDPFGSDGASAAGLLGGFALGGGRRHYHEARIEPGQVVTIVGMAMPFDQLPDPTGADEVTGGGGLDAAGGIADPEIVADLAEARAAGLLETDPAEAWGNAAIPGFGVGRPVSPPELDPGAAAPALASPAEAAWIDRTFTIDPSTLILASTPQASLLVSLGPPEVAVARESDLFLVGLLGALLAIASAVVLAAALSGGSAT